MRFTRRRSDRPDPALRGLRSSLEVLEGRELLSGGLTVGKLFAPWRPFTLPVYNPITGQPVPLNVQQSLIHDTNPQNTFLSNEGKIVSGTDRQGNQWNITVHGPGTVIVTDATPNDGSLDDNLATIQLNGTNPRRTYVTGTVVTSDRTPTDGTVLFNQLIANSGVKSIVLNGFTLTQTVPPPIGAAGNSQTGIFLPDGVGTLQFHDILAPINTANGDGPINIVIGDPSTPLRVAPSIRLDSIFNTVFNSTASTVNFNPQTDPTVNIIVNGQIKDLGFISSTQAPAWDPAQLGRNLTVRAVDPTLSPIAGSGAQFAFPIVGTTGRTSIQATGIGNLGVRGSAINVTAARGPQPFVNQFSGLNHLNHAAFGGNADGLGIDVNGPIRSLLFRRGLGSPVGTKLGPPTSTVLDATTYGTPAASYGFPSQGLIGGEVTSTHIRRIGVGPANTILQSPTNPQFAQAYLRGSIAYNPVPGQALTNSDIVSSGSIGHVHIIGTNFYSEIKTGFHYPSFAAGLEGTRAASNIRNNGQSGDIVDSMTSATVRPFNGRYQTAGVVVGPGSIRGHFNGSLYATGGTTPLGDQGFQNRGVGFFAARKFGYLPPPQAPKRINGVLVR